MTTDETASAAAPEQNAGDDGADANGAAEPTVEDLQTELESVRQAHARAIADYQNLQRRSAEERKEYAGYTLASVVLNFLPILDDLTRALESAEDDINEHPWTEGVRLVEQKFNAVLEAAGVTEIAAEGEAFDPNLHEAMAYVPGPDGQVVHRSERGYAIGDRIVRPARVMVGDGSSAEDASNGDDG
jgi:molecular chaperone GrpE